MFADPELIRNNRTTIIDDFYINQSLLPDLLPSAEAYVILKHYVSLPIFATSIICILITIAVVTRRGLWRPTVTYVVMLALVDLLILLLLSILSLDYFIIPWASEQFRMWFYSAETVLGETVDTLLFISNWLTAMLATERYVAICYPLHSRRITRKHRRIVVTLVVFVSIIIRIPGFVLLNMSNDPVTYPKVAIYHRFYAWLVQVILFLIVPFVLLTFVNLRLIQAVRRSSKLLQAAYGKDKSTPSKCAATSQVNSLANTSHPQIPEKRHYSKSGSDYCEVPCLFRSAKPDGLSSSDLMEQCPAVHSIESPTSSVSMGLGNCKMSANQCAIALTLYGPMGIHVHRASREERKITVTLVCLVITFFIFQGPSVLTSVIVRFTSASKSVIFENLLIPLSLIALAIKSDLYFFLYCWFCERFLNCLCNLLGLRKLRNWLRNLTCCKFRTLSNQYAKQFPCISRPSILQEFRLPHHHYGYQGKHPSIYARGYLAPNRYPYSYKPPPLPFVMQTKRKFPFWISPIKWSWPCATETHQKHQAMKRGKSRFVEIPNLHSEEHGTFVPPPDSYFSKRRIILVPQSQKRCNRFSLKFIPTDRRRCILATSRIRQASFNSHQDLLGNMRFLVSGRKNKRTNSVQSPGRPEVSSSTHTCQAVPGESGNQIASGQEPRDSWFLLRSLEGLPRQNQAIVPRSTGTVSAPVSTTVDVCVHKYAGPENEWVQSNTDSTLDVERITDQNVIVPNPQEATSWSV